MFTIVYFSATGNTKHLANNLREKLGEHRCLLYDILSADKLSGKGSHLVLMYPIHAFNAAKEMVDFAEHIPAGVFSRVSLIAVGCAISWINEANSLHLRKVIAKKGYEFGLDRLLAMPLTIVMRFPKAMSDVLITNAKKQILNIGDDLLMGVNDKKIVSLKSKLVCKLGSLEKHAAKLFGIELYANKNCFSCGKCWEQCAARNIYPDKNNKPKFRFNCSMCMKCIYACPVNAIRPRISTFIPLKGGYYAIPEKDIMQ